MTLDGIRRCLSRQPWWMHLLVVAATFAILAFSARAAWPNWDVFPAVPSGVIIAGAAFWKERLFWHLRRSDRVAVDEAMRTGVPTGSPSLDQIARARLTRRARSFRSDRVLAPLVMVVAAAIPIVAALRTGNACWLVGAAALSGQLIASEGAFPRDPRPSLASLTNGRA